MSNSYLSTTPFDPAFGLPSELELQAMSYDEFTAWLEHPLANTKHLTTYEKAELEQKIQDVFAADFYVPNYRDFITRLGQIDELKINVMALGGSGYFSSQDYYTAQILDDTPAELEKCFISPEAEATAQRVHEEKIAATRREDKKNPATAFAIARDFELSLLDKGLSHLDKLLMERPTGVSDLNAQLFATFIRGEFSGDPMGSYNALEKILGFWGLDRSGNAEMPVLTGLMRRYRDALGDLGYADQATIRRFIQENHVDISGGDPLLTELPNDIAPIMASLLKRDAGLNERLSYIETGEFFNANIKNLFIGAREGIQEQRAATAALNDPKYLYDILEHYQTTEAREIIYGEINVDPALVNEAERWLDKKYINYDKPVSDADWALARHIAQRKSTVDTLHTVTMIGKIGLAIGLTALAGYTGGATAGFAAGIVTNAAVAGLDVNEVAGRLGTQRALLYSDIEQTGVGSQEMVASIETEKTYAIVAGAANVALGGFSGEIVISGTLLKKVGFEFLKGFAEGEITTALDGRVMDSEFNNDRMRLSGDANAGSYSPVQGLVFSGVVSGIFGGSGAALGHIGSSLSLKFKFGDINGEGYINTGDTTFAIKILSADPDTQTVRVRLDDGTEATIRITEEARILTRPDGSEVSVFDPKTTLDAPHSNPNHPAEQNDSTPVTRSANASPIGGNQYTWDPAIQENLLQLPADNNTGLILTLDLRSKRIVLGNESDIAAKKHLILKRGESGYYIDMNSSAGVTVVKPGQEWEFRIVKSPNGISSIGMAKGNTIQFGGIEEIDLNNGDVIFFGTNRDFAPSFAFTLPRTPPTAAKAVTMPLAKTGAMRIAGLEPGHSLYLEKNSKTGLMRSNDESSPETLVQITRSEDGKFYLASTNPEEYVVITQPNGINITFYQGVIEASLPSGKKRIVSGKNVEITSGDVILVGDSRSAVKIPFLPSDVPITPGKPMRVWSADKGWRELVVARESNSQVLFVGDGPSPFYRYPVDLIERYARTPLGEAPQFAITDTPAEIPNSLTRKMLTFYSEGPKAPIPLGQVTKELIPLNSFNHPSVGAIQGSLTYENGEWTLIAHGNITVMRKSSSAHVFLYGDRTPQMKLALREGDVIQLATAHPFTFTPPPVPATPKPSEAPTGKPATERMFSPSRHAQTQFFQFNEAGLSPVNLPSEVSRIVAHDVTLYQSRVLAVIRPGSEVYVPRSEVVGGAEKGWRVISVDPATKKAVVEREMIDPQESMFFGAMHFLGLTKRNRLQKTIPVEDLAPVEFLETNNITELPATAPPALKFINNRYRFLQAHRTLSQTKYQELFGINLQQANVGDCYLIAAFKSLRESEENFAAMMSTSIRETATGWEVRIPIGSSSSRWIAIQPEDIAPQTVYHKNGTVKEVLYPVEGTTGYKILEAAYAKIKTGRTDVRRELIVGGHSDEALKMLLGNGVRVEREIGNNAYQSLERQNHADMTLDYLMRFHSGRHISTASSIHDFSRTDRNTYKIGKHRFYHGHAYAIESVKKKFDPKTKLAVGIESVTVKNPHDTSKPIVLTFEEFTQAFSTIRAVSIDYNNMFPM